MGSIRGKVKRTVAGFDLSAGILRMIQEGTVRLAIDQQPYVQGCYPVVRLAQYCCFGIMPSDIDAGAGVITADKASGVTELCRMNYR